MCPASHPADRETNKLVERKNLHKCQTHPELQRAVVVTPEAPDLVQKLFAVLSQMFDGKSYLNKIPDLADVDPHALAEALDPPGHGECLGHDAVTRQLGARHHADCWTAARERESDIFPFMSNIFVICVRILSCGIPCAH